MSLWSGLWTAFRPPYLTASSRLLLGSSWAKCPAFSLFILCSFQAAPSSKPHQNIIKNCLHFACVLIAFQKTRTKTLLVCMEGLCVVCSLPFSKSDTLRGGYRKDRDCSRLFLLFVAAPRLCIVRFFVFPFWDRHRYPWIILR